MCTHGAQDSYKFLDRCDAINELLDSCKKSWIDKDAISFWNNLICWRLLQPIYQKVIHHTSFGRKPLCKILIWKSQTNKSIAWKLLGVAPDGKVIKRMYVMSLVLTNVASMYNDATLLINEEVIEGRVHSYGMFILIFVSGKTQICAIEARNEVL